MRSPERRHPGGTQSRSGDHGHMLLPLYWVLSGSCMTPRAFRRASVALAREFVFQNWSMLSVAGAARRDQLRSECGDVGSYTVGHRSGGLQHHLAKASWRKLTSVIHADEPDAPGDRFRDSALVMFSRANLVNTLPGLILADMTLTIPFALVMLCAVCA